MGGMIAQEYAIAHADRLLSASFCCTYSYPGPFCLRMFSCWRDLVPTLGVGFTQREVILWAFTTDFFEQHEDVLIEIEGFMAANPQPLESYLAQLTSIEQHDTRGRLGAVTCPAMTLVGAEDILIYPKLSRRLHDELPRLHVGRGAGRARLPVGAPRRLQRGGAGLPVSAPLSSCASSSVSSCASCGSVSERGRGGGRRARRPPSPGAATARRRGRPGRRPRARRG